MSPSYTSPNMRGKVALVAGASRGAGRGIAVALGEAGATVYCTGRSSRATRNSTRSASMRLETVEETAERVTLRGGLGIPVFVDHTNRGAVQMLIARIEKEHGKLDILVNNIWGGDPFLEFGKPFWQLDLPKGFQMMEGALYTHIITCHFAAPLLIESDRKSTRLNSSHSQISYAVFCLKKKIEQPGECTLAKPLIQLDSFDIQLRLQPYTNPPYVNVITQAPIYLVNDLVIFGVHWTDTPTSSQDSRSFSCIST